jgi:hypothetical protein
MTLITDVIFVVYARFVLACARSAVPLLALFALEEVSFIWLITLVAFVGSCRRFVTLVAQTFWAKPERACEFDYWLESLLTETAPNTAVAIE